MSTVPATEVKQRLGQYLDSAKTEPVFIEKSGRPSAVLLSIAEYERLCALEDRYWGEMAKKAEASGYAGAEETLRQLRERTGDAEA
ncbi:type II toxin-antitoxin system Phd/YefM family antitoxin [Methylogaea oryzae]|uniref:Antitoxin n=1 Tax=Methylogaea oryzae TaxID=1295382 RepID=A0A8D5ALH5_9GAMM|nr:type II toxin-antitoxin system Phd/YefM family antitoxin [Methylogaea oryzae]BBL72121.1 hypothetical protein MoryE10_27270 [Methylogaea oryzae]